MRYMIIALFALVICVGGCSCAEHSIFQEQQTQGTEFMAMDPSGKVSPIFRTEQQVKKWIEDNNSPDGTVIFKREKK